MVEVKLLKSKDDDAQMCHCEIGPLKLTNKKINGNSILHATLSGKDASWSMSTADATV